MKMPARRGLLAAAVTAATIASFVPVAVSAQARPVQNATPVAVTALLRDIATAEQKILALAEAIPEQHYGWRPADGTRSISEVLVHIAADNYFLPAVAGTAAPEPTGIRPTSYESVQAYESRSMSKAESIAAVRASFAHMRGALEGIDDAFLARSMNVFGMEMTGLDFWILSTTHLHEHLGQLIAYARSNGVVPPWSQ